MTTPTGAEGNPPPPSAPDLKNQPPPADKAVHGPPEDKGFGGGPRPQPDRRHPWKGSRT